VTLFGAIQAYVDVKRAHGVLFEKEAKDLRSFSRRVGDVPLDTISPGQILAFLNGPRTSNGTWRKKFNLLKFFFEYWSARALLDASPMPPRTRPPVAQSFVPYVYTRNEVRLLLRATSLWQKSSWQNMKICRMDSRTFRVFLLTLYATGMRTGEALNLLRKDVNVNRSIIIIRGDRYSRPRNIPIGPDLKVRLQRHKRDLAGTHGEGLLFFVGKEGKALNENALRVAFRRLRRLAGIQRYDGAIYQPRMHDLRATFAVHRLTSWLRQGGDLNRLIPALSAYMGQVRIRIDRAISEAGTRTFSDSTPQVESTAPNEAAMARRSGLDEIPSGTLKLPNRSHRGIHRIRLRAFARETGPEIRAVGSWIP
jgi:integrase/recombinase XerD